MRVEPAALSACLLSLCACTAVSPGPEAADELRLHGTVVARYVHATYDRSDERTTCKVWHELSSSDGRVLTKGTGGQFEHHRGLFFGFQRTEDRGRVLDFWHCNHGESQRHVDFCDPRDLGLEAGDFAAHIDWCDGDGTPVVHERRALAVRDLGDGWTHFECVAELTSDRRVRLGGDPQHSGHQFRALDRFAAKDGAKVRYVRPAGMTDQGNDVWTSGEWIAAILPFLDEEGGPVTVLRVEGRSNPRPSQWSTRDYGRFGATFACELEPGQPLRLRWHYAIGKGSADATRCAEVAARLLAATDFEDAPRALRAPNGD